MASPHLTPKETWRYRQLFGAIIFLFFATSFLELNAFWTLVLSILLSVTTLLAIRTFPLATFTKVSLRLLLFLALGINLVQESPALPNLSLGLQVLSSALYALFLGLTILFLSQRFLQVTDVNTDVIIGSVSVYLLLGIFWFILYDILLNFNPDAFKGLGAPLRQSQNSLLYFSFTTLTTLGFGDITPVHPAAMGLANLEAIAGQLYPAILIARLVSLFSVQQEEELPPE
ncbi:MAG: potassium channel family protein [Cyanobacteriota bacterium]|jgi:voltage-gated potassium channel